MTQRLAVACAIAWLMTVGVGASSAAGAPSSANAVWGFGSLGSGVGLSGILTATNGTRTEIYVGGSGLTFGANTSWQALAYSPTTGNYDQVFISPTYPATITQLSFWHSNGKVSAILVALGDGRVWMYDLATKRSLGCFVDPCSSLSGLSAFASTDLTGDGTDEIVSICGNGSLQVYGNGYTPWSVGNVGGYKPRIVVGQMDDDAALEIATNNGQVIDTASHAVQWNRAGGFGRDLQAADIDGDGRDELLAGFEWDGVWSYDVERQLPKWHLPLFDLDVLLVADVNGDGVNEIVVGDGQWGSVHAYDPVTLLEKWSIANPEHGVGGLAAADVNGDGAKEILWGGGYSSTGSDHLYVGNVTTKTILWQSEHLDGPFVGPEIGDLDGDGVMEIVVASYTAESGYQSGRIVVLDSRTGGVRGIFRGVAGNYATGGINDLKLRDLNKDGRQEIVVATDWLYDGVIEAYSFSASNAFTKVFTNATRPYGAGFYSVEVADLDGNGSLEVIGGVRREHTGSLGTYVYVYDAATGIEKYKVPVQVQWEPITSLIVSDLDGDGHLEVAALAKGKGVYIFDGVTQSYDAIIADPGRTMTAYVAGGRRLLLIGNDAGQVSVHEYDGGVAYPELGRYALGAGAIDGIHLTPSGSFWFSASGVLYRLQDSYRTANYGQGFGRTFATLGNSVLSAGDHGVHAFAVKP